MAINRPLPVLHAGERIAKVRPDTRAFGVKSKRIPIAPYGIEIPLQRCEHDTTGVSQVTVLRIPRNSFSQQCLCIGKFTLVMQLSCLAERLGRGKRVRARCRAVVYDYCRHVAFLTHAMPKRSRCA